MRVVIGVIAKLTSSDNSQLKCHTSRNHCRIKRLSNQVEVIQFIASLQASSLLQAVQTTSKMKFFCGAIALVSLFAGIKAGSPSGDPCEFKTYSLLTQLPLLCNSSRCLQTCARRAWIHLRRLSTKNLLQLQQRIGILRQFYLLRMRW
jgi:hypothetical protein